MSNEELKNKIEALEQCLASLNWNTQNLERKIPELKAGVTDFSDFEKEQIPLEIIYFLEKDLKIMLKKLK